MVDPDFRELLQRPDLAPLVKRFENLGVSCELGLVQRHCQVEQAGLFRFGYTPLGGLIAALNTDFRGIGDGAEIRLHEFGGEWITTHQRFGFEAHTQHSAEEYTDDAIRETMKVHFLFLARKLLEDIEDSEKIFVYRPRVPGPATDDARAMMLALQRHGQPLVLWVDIAKQPDQIGTVEWTVPGKLMTGYLDRYADIRFAAGASFGVWLQVLDAALHLVNDDLDPETGRSPKTPWVVYDPVVRNEQSLHLRRPSAPAIQLRLTAEHLIADLPTGWAAVATYTGLEPFLLLVLQHQQWGRETWFFTKDGYKIGNHVDDLSIEQRAQLHDASSALFSRATNAWSMTQSVGFSLLSAHTQRDIFALLTS
jgi:hypothetical protein